MADSRVDEGALRRVMADYATALCDSDLDAVATLARLTEHCVTVLDLSGAAIALAGAGAGLELATSSDGRARRMAQAQLAQSDGPSTHAVRTGQLIAVEDLQADDRWPAHHATADAVGYRGMAAVPMPAGRTPIGALHLYDDDRRTWHDDELAVASLLADLSAGHVLRSRTLEDSQHLSQQLQHALDSRVVVEQAKGMLAAQLTIDVNEAFEHLRAHARGNQVRVREVAEAILAGTLSLDGAEEA